MKVDTKNMVLSMLIKNISSWTSGEAIGKKLGISRAAISKAICMLREEGYDIHGVNRLGYCLKNVGGVLSPRYISSSLSHNPLLGKVYIYDTINSTNEKAKQLAMEGASNGSIVIAESQTQGRGRYSKNFYSPVGGVYLSLILRPSNIFLTDALSITCAAAICLCDTIKYFFKCKPHIKWVNDIMIGDKKVCGILTEGVTDFESGAVEFIIVGVGVNFDTKDFPPELQNIAVSLSDFEKTDVKGDEKVSKNEFISKLSDNLLQNCLSWDENMAAKYRRLSATLGKGVEIIEKNGVTYGNALDIDKDGGLVVRFKNGEIRIVRSGEVVVIKKSVENFNG